MTKVKEFFKQKDVYFIIATFFVLFALVASAVTGVFLTGSFPPCGVCRQVMREFCEDDFAIYMVGADGTYESFTLAEILPHSFRASTHMV